MTDQVDGHRIGTAESSYFQRAGQGHEHFDAGRRPGTVIAACAAGTGVAVCALVTGWWMLFTEEPVAHAQARLVRSGLSTSPAATAAAGGGVQRLSGGQILLNDALFAALTALFWAGLVIGVWRGIAWVRRVGLVAGGVTAVLMALALQGCTEPVEWWALCGALLASAAWTALLLVPRRRWFDWRGHGPVSG